jgi:transcriptional regulator with XRE-family HTH domain
MKVLADRLRELRAEYDHGAGISHEKLAARIHACAKSVATWERGDGNPRADNLLNLADFFDVSADYLLGRTDHRRCESASAAPDAHVPRHWVAQRGSDASAAPHAHDARHWVAPR